MQGKQNMSNTERKGPHKSMHCKFCKPPGVVTPEKPTRAQLETKTELHLVHEAADLRVRNTHNEPGFPAVESEACVCVLEGENPCPKCVPDKNRPPPKKKVCRCPKGAKPHPSMYNKAAPKKMKQVDEDDEFWWEKYSREHDALAKETWAAYMAQRQKDRKLEKCQKPEREELKLKKTKGVPSWYQKLSCQQMIYVESLSTAIRLDSDENITDRTYFVLGGIGLHPRPKRKVLKKCLRYCHYNSIQFLNQLHIIIKDEDPFQEKPNKFVNPITWNERLIMNSICYLEFPSLLRELMDRIPPLPKPQILPQIPYPVFTPPPRKEYSNPYEEPIWQDRLNWVEKNKIDRLNRCRLHLETKRVKIPALALIRRPSLIDARPPFLAQIEANERASRRLVKEKGKKLQKKHPISTFNSAIDVTAIAGIEASEISTTDKADTEDICVFLREPKESMEGEREEEDFFPEKGVRFLGEPPKLETQVNCVRVFSEPENSSEAEHDDIPFKTPPKTESGATIESPCPPPDATPGPPATHFDKGKRELDIMQEEICGFFPFVSSSTQIIKGNFCTKSNDIESNLKSAAEKLKKLANEDKGEEKSLKKGKKKPKKKEKCKKKTLRKKSKKGKPGKRQTTLEAANPTIENQIDGEEEEGNKYENDDEEGLDMLQISFRIEKGREKEKSQSESEVSDTEDEWSTRPPCMSDAGKSDAKEKLNDAAMRPVMKKRRGKISKRKLKRKKDSKDKKGAMEHKEKTGKNPKKKEAGKKKGKETTSDHYDPNTRRKYPEKEEEKKVEVFTGDVQPLVQDIIQDLAEEGYLCASYPFVDEHPDINQLILHLKGEILTKQKREELLGLTKHKWRKLRGFKKLQIQDLGISSRKIEKADWNDKKWISRLAKQKTDQFYYKAANERAVFGIEYYNTLFQPYFGTERYLKMHYTYMPSKYSDAVLRGIF